MGKIAYDNKSNGVFRRRFQTEIYRHRQTVLVPPISARVVALIRHPLVMFRANLMR